MTKSRKKSPAKRKAVVRKMWLHPEAPPLCEVVMAEPCPISTSEPVYVIRESDLPEVIERMAKGMYAQCNTVDTWKTTSQARREAVLETSRAGFASLGITTGGART